MTGKISVPADLDAVTTIGDEDHSGIDARAIEQIWDSVRYWYQSGLHPAIQVCLRHKGRVVLNRAIGHGWGNGPDDSPDTEKILATPETPFCVYSAAKAISSTVVHMLVERGYFSLDDRVCDYLPEYTSHGKDRTTIRHVMTHSAGVPIHTGPRPDVTKVNDSEYTRQQLAALKPVYRPGLIHIYHGLTWGPLIREIVSAATGRNIRDILAEEILRATEVPVDQLRRAAGRGRPGGTQPRHGQAVARTHRRGVPRRGGRHARPDHPAEQHAAVPHEHRAVVEHGVQRRRAVTLRRDPEARWRIGRREDSASGNPSGGDGSVPPDTPGCGDWPQTDALGHRLHARR